MADYLTPQDMSKTRTDYINSQQVCPSYCDIHDIKFADNVCVYIILMYNVCLYYDSVKIHVINYTHNPNVCFKTF